MQTFIVVLYHSETCTAVAIERNGRPYEVPMMELLVKIWLMRSCLRNPERSGSRFVAAMTGFGGGGVNGGETI